MKKPLFTLNRGLYDKKPEAHPAEVNAVNRQLSLAEKLAQMNASPATMEDFATWANGYIQGLSSLSDVGDFDTIHTLPGNAYTVLDSYGVDLHSPFDDERAIFFIVNGTDVKTSDESDVYFFDSYRKLWEDSPLLIPRFSDWKDHAVLGGLVRALEEQKILDVARSNLRHEVQGL